MASITFEGPDPTHPVQRATTVIEMSDEAMLLAVQGMCESTGYTPESGVGPGTWAILQIINNFKAAAQPILERQARQTADAQREELLGTIRIQ